MGGEKAGTSVGAQSLLSPHILLFGFSVEMRDWAVRVAECPQAWAQSSTR
jgi:hypothetical protein